MPRSSLSTVTVTQHSAFAEPSAHQHECRGVPKSGYRLLRVDRKKLEHSRIERGR
jgi:hypothetical protein